jgi:hypothetical protein
MIYETILVETRGRVQLITLDRPHALNALNTQLTVDVIDAVSGRFLRDRLHRHNRILQSVCSRCRYQGNAGPNVWPDVRN